MSGDLFGVYSGEQMARIRVQLALGSQELSADLDTGMREQSGGWWRVLVERRDTARAMAIIEALDDGDHWRSR